MSTASMAKPCRIELNNSGSWKLLGRFDAGDEEQAALVMDAAETLVLTLHNSENPKGCASLRISTDGPLPEALALWKCGRGWRDSRTGKPI